jgi:hypothetical protein
MLDPFETVYVKKTNNNLVNNNLYFNYIRYIIISIIYLIEALTATLGGLNVQDTNTFPNVNLKIQYWLLASGLYNIFGLILIYQFPLFTYSNKNYFTIYNILKFIWILIGGFILINYNKIINCNFIIGYSLFYIILNFNFMIYIFYKISKLQEYFLIDERT